MLARTSLKRTARESSNKGRENGEVDFGLDGVDVIDLSEVVREGIGRTGATITS